MIFSPRRLATFFAVSSALVFAGVRSSAQDAVAPPPAAALTKDPRWTAIVPAIETGATRFLQAHPEYDGRGVVAAIFDDGVDPGAPGLQVTPDGRPKILDVIDGTGAGDVDTSTEREAENGTLTGLTGRKLKLGESQQAAGRKYRLGWKAAYDFFPGEVIGRLKRERREKLIEDNAAVESMQRAAIEAYKKDHPNRNADEAKTLSDLEERLAQLAQAVERAEDFGPVFDVVVYHDGHSQRAIIDTDADGDLSDEKSLCDFSCEREFAVFGWKTSLNVAVHIDADGKRVSLVTPAGSHATHVAGILGGYDANRPENCGVAPGVQLISVRIGDPRLGAMETGQALVRAAAAAARYNVDLVNMSYGEPSARPDQGALTKILSDLVERRGVVYISSAGNEGPALSTVGAPGGTSSAILGIGAYVSPQMAKEQYSRLAELGGLPYTWSSRGPTLDGDLGVDLLAPGGAFAPVPNFTRQGRQHMNGTSMSSPNACGTAALLLSGLRAQKVKWTPASIAKALSASAKPVEGVERFAQGAGMIQVDAAFDYAVRWADAPGEAWNFDVETSQRRGSRGILLREPADVAGLQTFNVRVTPRASKYWEETVGSTASQQTIAFDMRLSLESSAPWVKTAESLVLPYRDRSFAISVDPSLAPAGASFAEIIARDADSPERGPLFRVPVTVLRPTATAHVGKPIDLLRDERRGEDSPANEKEAEFKPGEMRRCFVHAPLGATWATVRLKQHSDGPRAVSATVAQTPVDLTVRDPLVLEDAALPPHEERLLHTPVIGGRTLEVCVAQGWNSPASCRIDATIEFHGLEPDVAVAAIPPGEAATRVELRSLSGDAARAIHPRGSFDVLRRLVAPKRADVKQLDGSAESLPAETTMFELKLTYEFERESAGAVTPQIEGASQMLYESPLASLTWHLHQGDRRIASDDVFPGPHRLERGPYRLVASIWATDKAALERLKATPLWLDESIGGIGLTAHATRAEAVARGESFGRRLLQPGASVAVHIAAPSRWPSEARAGDVLLGSITYGVSDDESRGAGDRPRGWPVWAVVPRRERDEQQASGEKFSLPRPTDTESLAATTQAARIKILEAIPQDKLELFNTVAAALLQDYPGAREPLVAKLHWLDHEDHREERLEAIAAAADAVLATLDEGEIAATLGLRRPDEGPGADEYREREKQRDVLIDAIYRKGRALGYRELPEVVAKHPIEDPAAFDAAFETNFIRLARWVNPADRQYSLLLVRRERRKDRLGLALKALEAHRNETPIDYWHVKKRRDLYESLGWKHLQEFADSELLQRFPKGEE